MGVKNVLMKIAGKGDFELDNSIPFSYIIRLCVKYGTMAIRGKLLAIGHKGISNSIFVGKRTKMYCKRLIDIGLKTKIHNNVKIDALSQNGVVIGKHCVIGERTRIECTGSLKNLGKGVVIGDRTTFGSDCYFGAAGGIEIGNDVVAGQYIRFHSENHNYDNLNILIREQGVNHKGIKVGNNCWIGAGVVFLDGAELGDGCVVAANAVVAGKIPSNVVVGGIPAKLLKNR